MSIQSKKEPRIFADEDMNNAFQIALSAAKIGVMDCKEITDLQKAAVLKDINKYIEKNYKQII